MITGVVNASQEAVIRLKVRGPNGQEYELDAIIDTGFTGFLTLPAAVIASLGFPFAGYQQVILGDGSTQLVEVYTGVVEWDGQTPVVEIDSAETDPLMGMSLLSGYKLTIETINGGMVLIERL